MGMFANLVPAGAQTGLVPQSSYVDPDMLARFQAGGEIERSAWENFCLGELCGFP